MTSLFNHFKRRALNAAIERLAEVKGRDQYWSDKRTFGDGSIPGSVADIRADLAGERVKLEVRIERLTKELALP